MPSKRLEQDAEQPKSTKQRATPRAIRRLAFQTLYQLDARGAGVQDAESVLESLGSAEGYNEKDRAKAFEIASEAFKACRNADSEFEALAPTWPAHRQAAVDRAILRLAHYEMTSTDAPPKAVVNESIELAKAFSTEKSPSFINGLLDKVLKRVLAERAAQPTRPEVEG